MGRVDFQDIKHEERTLGGVKIPVAVMPHFRKLGYTARIFHSLKGLLEGMRLTFYYLVHPSKVVTSQYPENRATLTFPERYRASLVMPLDANGYHACTGCRLCEKACPNASILITTRRNPVTDDREIDRYVWRLDSCVFCNACVQVCPCAAIEMKPYFENAVYDRRLLIYTLNRFAGPTAKTIEGEEDPEMRKKLIATLTPRDPYGGAVPVNGHPLPNIRPLNVTPRMDEQPPAVASGEGADT